MIRTSQLKFAWATSSLLKVCSGLDPGTSCQSWIRQIRNDLAQTAPSGTYNLTCSRTYFSCWWCCSYISRPQRNGQNGALNRLAFLSSGFRYVSILIQHHASIDRSKLAMAKLSSLTMVPLSSSTCQFFTQLLVWYVWRKRNVLVKVM